jgi:hypothetical protein
VTVNADGGYCRPLLSELFAVNRHRCFFITAKEHLGLESADTRMGDPTCVVHGSGQPFVLRAAGLRQWRLQGDAYVRGIMKGQLVESPWTDNKGDEQYSIFRDGVFVLC